MTATLEQPAAGRVSSDPTGTALPAGDTSATVPRAGTSDRPKVRDGFLDTVRAIALIRVIIWHTLAMALVSWIVASMPAMFFVAGSLLARSLDKQPLRTLFRTRLRRLLLPFWAFGAVVLSVLVLVHHLDPTTATALAPKQLLAWIFPIVDPHGNAWEAGWASTPLWYLRCYLWLLLLSPLMRKAHRRWGLRILIVPIALVFAFDFLIRDPASAPAAFLAVKYYLSDLATFSIFWILGFAHSDGVIGQLDRRARLEWAAIGAAGAFVWITFVHPSTMVVNDSYPLSLFVGIAWLGLFLAAEKWIGRATEHGFLGPLVRWLGSRSITVYLWHPIAIVGAYWLRSMFFPALPRLAVLPLVFALVVLLAVLFGRIEDHSAGRPGQWWPGRQDPAILTNMGSRIGRYLPRRLSPVRSMVIGAVVGVLILGVLVPSEATQATTGASDSDGLALPPAPSKKPDQADFGTSSATASGAATASATAPTATAAATTAAAAATAGVSPPTGTPMAIPAAGTAEAAVTAVAVQPKVQKAIDAWRTAKGVAGAEMGVMLPNGAEFTVVSGKNIDGSVLDPTKAFPITSITKTMTSAITLELVKEGKIGLDDLLPPIKSVPGLPYVGKVTIRQILNHTAGIQPYDTTPGYAAVKSGPLTPETALALDLGLPLQWAPGSQVGYSNSGYLTLGLLDEQLTGRTYAQLLQSRVFGPAGMSNSSLNTVPTAGWSGFSAGGVDATLTDLLGWGDSLYRRGKILDSASLKAMLDVSNQFNTGLGAFPVCPCSTVNSSKVYSSIGHNGGQTTLQWAPQQNIVMSLNLTESLFTTHLTQADVATLLAAVETAVTTR